MSNHSIHQHQGAQTSVEQEASSCTSGWHLSDGPGNNSSKIHHKKSCFLPHLNINDCHVTDHRKHHSHKDCLRAHDRMLVSIKVLKKKYYGVSCCPPGIRFQIYYHTIWLTACYYFPYSSMNQMMFAAEPKKNLMIDLLVWIRKSSKILQMGLVPTNYLHFGP